MKLRLVLLAALLAFAAPTWAVKGAIEPLPFQNHAQEVRFQHLTKQLRCLVCQNENLADSNADLARDLRLEVFQLMQQGKTDAQIKAYLVARYGDFVLYQPPLKPGTWLLWFGPAAILLAGGVVVVIAIRRRRRLADNHQGAATAGPSGEAPENTGDDW
ncbi:MAG: cytochrome c-type biogenesis protein CcmH [Rhodanobacter sp.]|nr:MAG: cytochrome c-type biogenesis protein CcmH [Rhodanobacter sp.]TAM10334.1 MAG: cytochrome c-type biogenesis protein CcmH [Rhodanobacter sp.]TAM34432.1 MAG: cytochrome c-type biogenesis protein CcmH [Rhodanobacter sp.]